MSNYIPVPVEAARKWAWIVWHVWGPKTLGKGVGPSLEIARMACLTILRDASGKPGPGTNIEVD